MSDNQNDISGSIEASTGPGGTGTAASNGDGGSGGLGVTDAGPLGGYGTVGVDAGGNLTGGMVFTAGDAVTLGNDLLAVSAALTAYAAGGPPGAVIGGLAVVAYDIGTELAHAAGGTGQMDMLAHAFSAAASATPVDYGSSTGLVSLSGSSYGVFGYLSDGQMNVSIQGSGGSPGAPSADKYEWG